MGTGAPRVLTRLLLQGGRGEPGGGGLLPTSYRGGQRQDGVRGAEGAPRRKGSERAGWAGGGAPSPRPPGALAAAGQRFSPLT